MTDFNTTAVNWKERAAAFKNNIAERTRAIYELGRNITPEELGTNVKGYKLGLNSLP